MSVKVIRPAHPSTSLLRVLVPPREIGDPAYDRNGPEGEIREARAKVHELREEMALREGRWRAREEEMCLELARVIEQSAQKEEEVVDRFKAVVEDFVAQREELIRSSEETVVRLAVAMARRIIGDTVNVNHEVVLETVRRALRRVVEKESVSIHVNPDDLKIVRDHRSEWLGVLEGARVVEIVEDDRIARGGCVVETEAGNVEAQIEKQLRTLERELVERVR